MSQDHSGFKLLGDIDLNTKKLKNGANDILQPEPDGQVTFPKQSRARAYLSATNQIIGTGVWTKAELDGEDYDEQSEFDPTTHYRFTAKKAGCYQVIGQLVWLTAIANKDYGIAIKKTGNWQAALYNKPESNGKFAAVISDIAYLAVDAYLELFAYQASGGDNNIQKARYYTFMAIHKLS